MNDDRSHTGNLNRLADHLEALPSNYLHFDMESYFHDPRLGAETGGLIYMTEAEEIARSYDLVEPVEGMCGCAIGHSAAAGNFAAGPSWAYVAMDLYGVEGDAYEYLFGGDWYVRDNTPMGAARRIREYLRSGVPTEWRDEDEDAIVAVLDFIRVQGAEPCPA